MEALADREFSGGLISLFRNTMEFIESNTKIMWRKTGAGRINYPEYPERAYEEGLVNALIHRDYLELGSEVHVDIYDDRMEITSPGGMPSGRCVQELDARQVTSKRRNPVIADLFQRLDLMERRGSGFKKILDAYAFESEKRGETVEPRFESTQTDFFLILPNLNYGRKINGVESSSEHFEHDTVNGIVNDTAEGIQNPPVNPPGREVRATLTKSAQAVLAALESDSSMTYDTLAAKLKLHRDTIRVSIASLVRMKLLRRVGSDKTGHWEVVR
jgi:predicted HTH transcriptional regulator